MAEGSIGILLDFDSDGFLLGVDSDPLEFATKKMAIDNHPTAAGSYYMLVHVVMWTHFFLSLLFDCHL